MDSRERVSHGKRKRDSVCISSQALVNSVGIASGCSAILVEGGDVFLLWQHRNASSTDRGGRVELEEWSEDSKTYFVQWRRPQLLVESVESRRSVRSFANRGGGSERARI